MLINLLKLSLALLLGGLIGYERETKDMSAGLRTHILVCVGATLIQIISIDYYLINGLQFDPMRLGAQVVSGIGFLGAGAIIKDGTTAKGLTTAASVWTVAGIGLAIGSGLYGEAIMTTLIIYGSLTVLKKVEQKIRKVSDKSE